MTKESNTAPAAATVLTDERIDLALMALQEAGEIAQAALGAKKSGTELRTQFKRIINVARAGIADVERLLAHAGVAAEPAKWRALNDVEWMNIVNHDHAYHSFTKDEAVHEAVKRTEWKLRELNEAAPTIPAQAPAADEVRAAEWISVEDRLPEMHVTVALLDENRWMNTGSNDHSVNWHGAGYLCEFGQKYWSIFGEMRSQCLDAVTHWMPLPAAPAAHQSTANNAEPADQNNEGDQA